MGLSPPEVNVTRWWSKQPPVDGYWGPSTSSIDWCEANYAITRFIAEFANTLSNLAFFAWAFYGVKKCRDEKLPLPLALCQVGIALVGIGSFMFHATLHYEWQLADELPMIFSSAFTTYVVFDTGRASLPRSRFVRSLPFLLFLYCSGFTAIYLRHPNPVFLQVAFAAIQLTANFRAAYTICTAPVKTCKEQKNKAQIIRYLSAGFFTTLIGFLIWNVDNIFCDRISHLKQHLGIPWSFAVEGHAWWHLATGTGAYLSTVGLQLMSVSFKEGADGFEIKRGGILALCPYVARTLTNMHSKLD
ncbi:hypothetical protein PTTG_02887 [Puccinia triticina 1-1 BBBD Race 1]|uniref:Alkaline ceramidase 3 n=2 Tax=Puccinia triticina TaxID=208348 RepID=A0A180H2B6_PUCT1|nr:uncharacterized protein PtA15_4A165 [Puccinia triticina]OAV99145.1 hypothetical protein PTTG_02887 [Puccinia triticina 1-1 BBBD Race 1]WAQ83717.1 hypothetical protein PtA15_4A165 [Puccinia triticina]WAR54560.1 hypothetical protein PtB15_4B177 [Puccinia triticina]